MDKRFTFVDMDGNPRQFDLFAFLKQINESIETTADGKIIIHLPPPPEPKGNR